MKQGLGLIIGLLVGAVGMFMFSKSLPPEEGSTEEAIEIMQRKLDRTEREIRELEASSGRRGKRNVGDGVRDIMQDIREGKEVSMDDVFATMKPWMRDMAPLFNRMREINQDDWADNMTGEWARKYDLNKAEKEELRQWFMAKSKEKGAAFEEVVASDTSGFVDFVRATEYDMRDSDGIDEVMESFLEGEELTLYQEERISEKSTSVQEEANRGLTRLDRIVELDEQQQDEVFAILARGSSDYQAGEMAFDGMGSDTSVLDRRARDEAIRGVMRPEQAEVFDNHQAQRKAEAEKEMKRMGMSLPKGWDLLEGDSF